MPATMESITSALTPILALYGAVLSTYICIRTIRAERVRVFVTHGWTYGMTARGMAESPETLNLSAVNTCRKDIVVSSLALDVPGFCYITPRFLEYETPGTVLDNLASAIRRATSTRRETAPEVLKPGHELEVSFDHSQLVEVLRRRGMEMPLRVRAVFGDTLENIFFSSWFHIGEEPKAPPPSANAAGDMEG